MKKRFIAGICVLLISLGIGLYAHSNSTVQFMNKTYSLTTNKDFALNNYAKTYCLNNESVKNFTSLVMVMNYDRTAAQNMAKNMMPDNPGKNLISQEATNQKPVWTQMEMLSQTNLLFSTCLKTDNTSSREYLCTYNKMKNSPNAVSMFVFMKRYTLPANSGVESFFDGEYTKIRPHIISAN